MHCRSRYKYAQNCLFSILNPKEKNENLVPAKLIIFLLGFRYGSVFLHWVEARSVTLLYCYLKLAKTHLQKNILDTVVYSYLIWAFYNSVENIFLQVCLTQKKVESNFNKY